MGNECSQQVKYGEKLENDIKFSWKKSDSENPFAGRECHAATSIGSNVYIYGGVVPPNETQDIESNDLLVYNTDTSSWKKAEASGDLPPPCSAATLAAVDTKLYLFGGLSRHMGWFNHIHMYDTVTNVWRKLSTTGVAPRPRDKVSSAVIEDKIYIFGGFGPQGCENDHEGAQNDEEDEDYEDESDEEEGAQFGWFNDLFVFDTASLMWSNPLQQNLGVPSPRAAHGMCAIGKHLVVFGGRDSTARQNDLYIYDTDTRKWEVELMKVVNGLQPEPRSFHTVTAVEHRVVVFGGRGTSNQHFNGFDIFDTKTREWLQPAVEGPIPTARGCHSSVVAGGQLVIFGGTSDFNTETMQCDRFYNDIYTVPTAHITSGRSVRGEAADNQENVNPQVNTPDPKTVGLHVAGGNTNAMQS